MSAGYEHVEQDAAGDGTLPTYDDLREREGPNSRFGRWQQWIEKRAAERYADDTYESYMRRRNRGWEPAPPPPADATNYTEEPPADLPERDDVSYAETQATHGASTRRTRTFLSTDSSVPETVTAPAGQRLDPCHLTLHTFGSRFIPHANGPIRAVLPVLGDRYILVGHDEGLDVLDMFPDESLEGNPQDARRREIWRGEGVCQLALLEHASPGADRTPQGVVLALISPEPTDSTAEGKEPPRLLRMYNLASLVSLVRWTTSQKDAKPIDLLRAVSPMDQTLHKKQHGRHHSLVKGFKNISLENPAPSSMHPFPSSSTPGFAVTQDRTNPPAPVPPPKDYEPSLRARSSVSPPVNTRSDSLSSIDTTDSWDVVDDLPLRWATDFVALATPGSKLFNLSVLFFEVWKADDGLGRTMLAIATKNTIFLYDTPQGARAFRYVKEFYTPLPPKSLAFVAQAHYDPLARAGSQLLSPRHADTGDARRLSLRGTSPPNIRPRSVSSSKAVPQLSLFVTFEKKAGLIRIGDAAVSELDLWDDAGADGTHPGSHGTFRRSLVAFDALGFGREGRGSAPWLPLCSVSVPSNRGASASPLMETVYLLSRGKATHILPSPLPVPLSARPPLYILRWMMRPTHVHARACKPSPGTGQRPFLQATAFGEDGVEVQEINLEVLLAGSDIKGKGKATAHGTLRAQVDVGGPAGFLCVGGNWDDPLGFGYNLHRSDSVSTVDSVDVRAQRTSQQGMYAWSSKGWEDYRVFWLGGDVDDPDDGPRPTPNW